jgi:hypothetical protein
MLPNRSNHYHQEPYYIFQHLAVNRDGQNYMGTFIAGNRFQVFDKLPQHRLASNRPSRYEVWLVQLWESRTV